MDSDRGAAPIGRWRKKRARGDVIVVRFLGDFVVGFQHRLEAEQFLVELRERFAKFALELHPEKTRLVEFVRFAMDNRRQRDDGKPASVHFLGVTRICAKNRMEGLACSASRCVRSGRRSCASCESRCGTAGTRPSKSRAPTCDRSSSALPLLRSADERPRAGRLPHGGRLALVARPPTAQPGQPSAVAPDEASPQIRRWLPTPRICHPWPRCASASPPNARAGCGNAARPDPWGGDQRWSFLL